MYCLVYYIFYYSVIIFILGCYFTVCMLLPVCVSCNYKMYIRAPCILREVYSLKYVLLRTGITHALLLRSIHLSRGCVTFVAWDTPKQATNALPEST